MNAQDGDGDNIALRRIGVRTVSLGEMRIFYEALGFEVHRRDGLLDPDHLEIFLGGVVLVVRSASAFQPAVGGIDLDIEVEDPVPRLSRALEMLHPGAEVGGPVSSNLQLTDPDGRRIMLIPCQA